MQNENDNWNWNSVFITQNSQRIWDISLTEMWSCIIMLNINKVNRLTCLVEMGVPEKSFILIKLWFDLQWIEKARSKGWTNKYSCMYKWEKGWEEGVGKMCVWCWERREKNQLFWAMQSNFHQFHESPHRFWVLHLLQGTMVLFWHWLCHNKELFPWPHYSLRETPMITERTKQMRLWDFFFLVKVL